jgi:arsenate reductase
MRVIPVTRLRSFRLAPNEREPLVAALNKAGLPVDDLDAAGQLFFRFESLAGIPVGFGGIAITGDMALLRSIVTLPPLRGRGFGRSIVDMLEQEAALRGCRAIFLLTTDAADYFEALGYSRCKRDDAPRAIRQTRQFATLCPASAVLLVKQIG